MPKHNFELRLELWIEAIMTQTFQYSRRPLSLAEVIWEDDDKVVFVSNPLSGFLLYCLGSPVFFVFNMDFSADPV